MLQGERLEPSTIQGGLMRRVGLLLAAALAAAVFAYPASGERGSWNNWHVDTALRCLTRMQAA